MADSMSIPVVLPSKFGGGPRGLGDPNDRTLRKVEKEVLIPKIMRERAKVEKCADEVKNFTDCCKESNILMVFTCRHENARLHECLTKWYQNEDFQMSCKEQYLAERSEYRRTGILKKHKNL